MTLEEYIEQYDDLSTKEMTKNFNEFNVEDRKDFLDVLSETERKKFTLHTLWKIV